MISTSRSRTLIAAAGALLLVLLGATPAASAAAPRHWVTVDGQASGAAEGINAAGDVLMIDGGDAWRLHRADGVDVELDVPLPLSPPYLVGPNDAGQVLAVYEDIDGNAAIGIFDRDGHFTALRHPPGAAPGWNEVGANDINNNGVVIGTALIAGHEHLVHWTRHGHPRLLDNVFGDDVAVAPVAVNDHGDIAAWIERHPGPAGRRGVVLDRAGHLLRYLHRLPGEDYDEPVDINDAGVVIGQSEVPGPSLGFHTYVPLRWGTRGVPHRFAAPRHATDVNVSAINDHGVMAGSVQVPFGTQGHTMSRPVVWTSATEYTILHSLPVPPDPIFGPQPQSAGIAALNDQNVLAGTTAEAGNGALTFWQPSS